MTNTTHNRTRFWLDGIGQAALALRDNRLRTVLSILGITIGIAAVMAVDTISKGGRYLIFKELETFGLNCYGCCEGVHLRIDAILKDVPRLRRVSVAPRFRTGLLAIRRDHPHQEPRGR